MAAGPPLRGAAHCSAPSRSRGEVHAACPTLAAAHTALGPHRAGVSSAEGRRPPALRPGPQAPAPVTRTLDHSRHPQSYWHPAAVSPAPCPPRFSLCLRGSAGHSYRWACTPGGITPPPPPCAGHSDSALGVIRAPAMPSPRRASRGKLAAQMFHIPLALGGGGRPPVRGPLTAHAGRGTSAHQQRPTCM